VDGGPGMKTAANSSETLKRRDLTGQNQNNYSSTRSVSIENDPLPVKNQFSHETI
jgi:hypothetical protein